MLSLTLRPPPDGGVTEAGVEKDSLQIGLDRKIVVDRDNNNRERSSRVVGNLRKRRSERVSS